MRGRYFGILLGVAACGSEQATRAPPRTVVVDTLEEEPPPVLGVTELSIAAQGSSVSISMDAPLELIEGRVQSGIGGKLSLDRSDLRKTHGVVLVDLGELVLTRQGRASATGRYDGEPTVNPVQNQHMRTWLEISEDAPSDQREKNRRAEFRIERLEQVSLPRLEPAQTPDSMTAIAVGSFLLHGHERPKQAPISSASFDWKDGKLVAVSIATIQPLFVELADHDVRPREAFGKLAQKTLEELASKVAPTVTVEVELVLVPSR